MMGAGQLFIFIGVFGCYIAIGTLGDKPYSTMLDADNILLIQNDTNKEWNYACPTTFTTEAANIACKQMGFPGLIDMKEVPNPDSTKSMLNVTFRCYRSLPSLSGCLTGPSICEEHEVVLQVDCIPLTPFAVRLIADDMRNGGHIEVFATDKNEAQRWIPLCEESLDNGTATVICNQLGFYGFRKKNYRNIDVDGLEGLKFDCDPDTNDNLEDCERKPTVQCTSQKAASIDCDLIARGTIHPGTIYQVPKIFYFTVYMGFSEWATVCSGPTKEDGDTICLSIGEWTMNKSVKVEQFKFMPPRRISYAPNCGGVGKPQHLKECPLNFQSLGECDSDTVFGVICNPPPVWSVHLKYARKLEHRLLSIYTSNAEWQGVCSQHFTRANILVVSKELGYAGQDLKVIPQPFARYASKAINLECDGTEESVADCHKTTGCSTEFLVQMIIPEPTAAPASAPNQKDSPNHEKEAGLLGPIWVIPVVAVIAIVLIVLVCMLVIMFRRQSGHERLIGDNKQGYSSTK